jgi:carbamoyltransferase
MRVLGITPFHDSSVAIINNGEIEYFCKEERLSKEKRAANPFLSLTEAFKAAKGDIDLVVICSPTRTDVFNNYLEKFVQKFTEAPVVRFCDHHHLAHASLAFYDSGFEKSLVVVIDRSGAKFDNLREGESVFIAEYPHNFTPIYKSYWLQSLGPEVDDKNLETLEKITEEWNKCELVMSSTCNITKVYETATILIGQYPLENGKTMGLAAYGKDKPYVKFFNYGIPNPNLFHHFWDGQTEPVILKDHIGKNIPYEGDVPQDDYQFYADHAYQVQKQTQEAALDLIKRKVEETGIKKVCVTGGYGLNVVANEYFIKHLPDVEFFFEPIADDTGNSIGSAMFVYRNETNDTTIKKIKDLFYNHVPHNFEVEGGIKVNTFDIANYLSNGKTVAVYNGQAEAGPRALGNRSILFDPRNPNAKSIVNGIKKREWYRPFAGSVLKEDVQEYFETHGLVESPFMTVSFQVKDSMKDVIPGIVHVDGSCRIQTVDDKINHFYQVLLDFKKITGISVLLNTSFNLAGKALVETPEDALRTFNNSDIDILWFPEKKVALIKES